MWSSTYGDWKMSILQKKQLTVKRAGTFIAIICLFTLWWLIVTVKETPHSRRFLTVPFSKSVSSSVTMTETQLPVVSTIKKVCEKKTRIAFIKVHKAASTTITSIIQRYGLSHNLTFALPRESDLYHIGFFETFDPANVRQLPKGKVYEALCQHVVYNREAFRKYLPRNMKIIAAVREPLARSASAFQYFHSYSLEVKSKSKANLSNNPLTLMREFLKNPEYYEPHDFKQGSLAYNRMAFDLGLPKAQYSNSTFVDQYIRQLDEDMSLVLIAEYFDQSLVLLKRIMCWSTKDILYQVRHKGSGIAEFPEDLKSAHRKLASVEYRIYDYFLSKFNTLYSNEVDIDEEVHLFEYTRHIVDHFCLSQNKQIVIEPTKFDKGFIFTQKDCQFLTMNETDFVKYLSKVQEP
ncbi:galactose-3-O-sulfotransferase 3-like [Liolophura sinensis]|uniref:galactose-3-O-sulfotransferase 3-like n=1 Tax=Liolophura sinensis TaxID=3198878 RepID=UPI003159861B